MILKKAKKIRYSVYIDGYDTRIIASEDGDYSSLSEARKEAIDHLQANIYELRQCIKHLRALKKSDIITSE